MHPSVYQAAQTFTQQTLQPGQAVAELGSLDINGSIRDFLPERTGFDLVSGPGVDVVIEPGTIPLEHRQAYDAVFSISSFQFCPEPALYRQQILQLARDRAWLFLTMCGPGCRTRHSSSDNAQGFGDSFRLSAEQLHALFADHFDDLAVQTLGEPGTHQDLVLTGRRRGAA